MYALGASRTIYVGDSGELVAAAYTLGIPHPSGYPLYVLVGKLWMLLLPFGSIAFRMSLLSAACAALTCASLHALLRRAGLHPVAAIFSALLLACAPSFWAEANVQRVYALNALFVAAATAFAFDWYRSRKDRVLVEAFLICGLGATNHTFMVVYGVALGLFALATDPDLLRRPLPLLKSAAAFVVGLFPYLYLPLRSRANPRLDWGNPETPRALFNVVLRRDFWGRAWIEGPADLLPVALDYLKSMGPELSWAGALLAAVGLAVAARRRWPVLLLLLVMVGNLVAVALHGSRTDIFVWHRYYIPSYFMAALLAGLGCQWLLERLPASVRPLLLVVPALAFLLRFPEFDRSRYRIAEDFSRTLLDTLPPGAHLTASDDNILFVLIYLHLAEGVRPDLDLILEGVGEANLPPLHFNPDTDPLFLTHHPNWRVSGLDVVPVGLVFQTVRSGQPPPPPAIPKTQLDGEADPAVPKDYLTQNLIGQFHYMLGITDETREWLRAEHQFQAAREEAPRNDVLFYNLGLIYRRNGLLPEAVEAFERSNEINPRFIPGASKVRASDKVTEVRSELEQLAGIEKTLSSRLDPGLDPGSAEYHRRIADLLEGQGLAWAARGHRLRALVAGGPPGVF